MLRFVDVVVRDGNVAVIVYVTARALDDVASGGR